jgi:hypothetical protein
MAGGRSDPAGDAHATCVHGTEAYTRQAQLESKAQTLPGINPTPTDLETIGPDDDDGSASPAHRSLEVPAGQTPSGVAVRGCARMAGAVRCMSVSWSPSLEMTRTGCVRPGWRHHLVLVVAGFVGCASLLRVLGCGLGLARFRSWCYLRPSGSAAEPHAAGGAVASSGGVLVWCSVEGCGRDLGLCSVVHCHRRRSRCLAAPPLHSCVLLTVRRSQPPSPSSALAKFVGSGEKMVPWCALSLSAFAVVLISSLKYLLLTVHLRPALASSAAPRTIHLRPPGGLQLYGDG